MRRFIASCSVVLLAIALLGACGGSDEKPGVASPDTKSDSSNDGNNSSDDDFSKLYADALKQKFKITFVDDSGDETTYAQDGNGKSVYGSGDSLVFTSSSGTVSCDTPSGGKAECTELPGGSSVSPFLGIYNLGRTYISALGRFGDKSSKTIADRDAECVTFSQKTVADAGPVGAAVASAIKGSLTYCVDKDTGVLLAYTTEDADGKTTDSFKVTKFEEPSDSDFTPPATPSSLPTDYPSISYPSGYTGPTIPGPD
jgi:hypothetical protein